MRTTGEIIESRRNHAATIITNKYMIVHGGINSHGKYLSDVCVFNIGSINFKK